MLKKLFSHVEGYGKYMIIAPVLVVIEVVCELALPKLMAGIVDEGIGKGNTTLIFQLGAVMVALSLICMLCGVLSAKYAAKGGQGFGANLRQSMFEHIQDFSFADIDRFSSASLITRMTNDVNNLQMTVVMGLRIITRAPVQLIAALALAIFISPKLALVLGVVIPVMVLAILLIMKVCLKLFDLLQRKIDALNGTVQENLVAIRVVKAFVRHQHEKEKFKRSNDDLTDTAIKVAMRIVLIQPVMMISLNVAVIGVLWNGGNMFMAGTLSVGDLASFLTYIMQILMSVMMLAMSLLQLSRAQASARRIMEVLDAESAIKDGALSPAQLPAPQGRVEFRDVSFKYQASGTGDDVLTGIDLTIRPGTFVAVVGGTGTGKSSLVNLIPRFYDVTGGQVLVDGVDVRDYPLEELRTRIGMVLQNNVLFSGTIRENLLWGKPDATEEELVRAAKDAQAYDFIMALPDGFDTHMDQGGVNVSGGQKQRLCIARAMLRQPAILILDDSTSAVDTATEAKIRQSFHDNLKNTTVIIIAQRISSVRYADEIVILDDGAIAAVGDHDTLMAESPIYKEIYDSQQEGGLE